MDDDKDKSINEVDHSMIELSLKETIEIEAIQQIFPESEYIVDSYGRYIKEKSGEYDITSNNGLICCNIEFERNKLYIHSLQKCSINGTETLKKLEELAKSISHINELGLLDASVIEKSCIKDKETKIFHFSLRLLKILTNGRSWYNSLGYVSDNYEEELKHNTEIIKMECSEFFEKVHKIYNEDPRPVNKGKEKEIEGRKRVDESIQFFDFRGLSVQIYFTRVLQYISSEKCDYDTYKWIAFILQYILQSKIILYDYHLTKRIQRGGGKSRKQRKSKKKRKQRKSRNQRNSKNSRKSKKNIFL
jgi:hypothetical protein